MKKELKLVLCSKDYWEFVRVLRNDPRVKAGFISDANITTQDQEKYMHKNSENYRIALLNGIPVGYVGVIDDDIRVCTLPEFQGKGIGKFLIHEIIKIWPDAMAKIKVENIASQKLFESCGFETVYLLMKKP